jgi:hypothetical protein
MTPWYSWAFDGVAGAAVVGIAIAVYQRYESKANRSGSTPIVSAGKSLHTAHKSTVSAEMSGPITDSQVAVGSNISQSVAVHHHYADIGISEKLTPTEPTPLQIIKAINLAKPYDKHRESEKFIDLEVTWRVKLSNLFPTTIYIGGDGKEGFTTSTDGAWMVTCVFEAIPFSKGVFVQFYLSEVPLGLKIAGEYASFLVQGRIEKVSTSGIVLRANPELLGFENF